MALNANERFAVSFPSLASKWFHCWHVQRRKLLIMSSASPLPFGTWFSLLVRCCWHSNQPFICLRMYSYTRLGVEMYKKKLCEMSGRSIHKHCRYDVWMKTLQRSIAGASWSIAPWSILGSFHVVSQEEVSWIVFIWDLFEWTENFQPFTDYKCLLCPKHSSIIKSL